MTLGQKIVNKLRDHHDGRVDLEPAGEECQACQGQAKLVRRLEELLEDSYQAVAEADR